MSLPDDIDQRLEAAMGDFFWAPDDVTVVERPELKYSRADRPEPFFNTVVRARPNRPGADVAEMVDEVVRAHRGWASRWCLSPLSYDDSLVAELERTGYAHDGHSYVGYALRPEEYGRRPRADVRIEQVRTLEDLRTLSFVAAEVFGGNSVFSSDEDMLRELETCTGEGARVGRFVAYLGDDAVGAAGCTLFPDLGVAFLWAGGVREEARGRGVYTGLLRARLDYIAAAGIPYAGLYAKSTTSAPIVAAHGFHACGEMRYWVRGS